VRLYFTAPLTERGTPFLQTFTPICGPLGQTIKNDSIQTKGIDSRYDINLAGFDVLIQGCYLAAIDKARKIAYF
jgi:hypothetical protein